MPNGKQMWRRLLREIPRNLRPLIRPIEPNLHQALDLIVELSVVLEKQEVASDLSAALAFATLYHLHTSGELPPEWPPDKVELFHDMLWRLGQLLAKQLDELGMPIEHPDDPKPATE